MIRRSIFCLASLTVSLVSCGDQTKSYSGNLGSCKAGDSVVAACVEYSYTGKLKKSPQATAQADAEASCKDLMGGGTYDAAGTCSMDDAPGSCAISKTEKEGKEDFTINAKLVFTGSGITADIGKSSCEDANIGGTWTAK